jgi:hypothetical protein
MRRQFFSGMRESKIQNFSVFHLHIFQGKENYESMACHQQTPLENTFSVTSGQSFYSTSIIPLKLKKEK